jgi:sulfofructose kinase
LALTDTAIFPVAAFDAFAAGDEDRARLRAILDIGPRHAGVTRGAKGYLWQNRAGQSGTVPAFKVDVIDTTGAGDAFHGAFTWAMAQGYDDARCGEIGAAVAAIKCGQLGARAGLPTRPDLEAFLSNTTVAAGL